MAADTTFPERFVLKYERTALRGVTLETSLILTEQLCSAALEILRQAGATAFNGASGVRVVAVRAAHLSFQNRMVMRHFKFSADFKVALETGVRRSARINDFAFIATACDVQASRPVT